MVRVRHSLTRPIAALLAIVALGLCFRIGAALTLPLPLLGDAADYDRHGSIFAERGQLLDADGSPSTLRPPGYSVFVGIIYALAGHHLVAVPIVQAILSCGVIIGLFFFGRQRFSTSVALIAAALYALSPAAVFSAASVLSETLGTTLLLVSCWLAVRAAESVSTRDAAVAGIVCAAMTLTRSVMVLFPLVLVLSFFACRRMTSKQRAALGGVLLVTYALGLTPWLVRNTFVLGSPMISTNGGTTLYASWVCPPGHLWGNNTVDALTEQAVHMSALEADRFLTRHAIQHVRDDPKAALWLIPQKLALLVVPWDYEVVGRGRSKRWNVHWPVVALLALWAFRDRTLRHSQVGALALLGFASLVLTSIVFYGSPRFRVPFEPLLLLPAALAIDHLWTRFVTPTRDDAGPGLTEDHAARR